MKCGEELLEQNSPYARQQYGGCCLRIAYFYKDAGRVDDAEYYVCKALNVLEPLIKRNGTVEHRERYCETLFLYAGICKEKGLQKKAFEKYEQCYELRKRIHDEIGTENAKIKLIQIGNEMIEMYIYFGNNKKARNVSRLCERLDKEIEVLTGKSLYTNEYKFLSSNALYSKKSIKSLETADDYNKFLQLQKELEQSGGIVGLGKRIQN